MSGIEFSGFQCCNDLTSKNCCIRLQKYNPGSGRAFTEIFHDHIPKHRLSQRSAEALLKTLVLVYKGTDAHGILRSYVNEKGKEPAFDPPLKITFEYPEPGVLRRICGGDALAWIDLVVNPNVFRNQNGDRPPSKSEQ